MTRLQDYNQIVGDKRIHEIYKKASKLYDKHLLHVNSTFQGGGVAEILNSMVPLLNDGGVETGWRILHGNPDFFGITKKFHNGLQGDAINMTDIKRNIYTDVNENFSNFTHINHDFVIIHDPQPLPLANYYQKKQPWIWRCHIDLSNPNPELWQFLKPFILKYDTVIVSHENYKKSDLPVRQVIIHPAIDPLTPKNKDLSDEDINLTLDKFNIPTDKPLITQISRFDKWKDPVGVLEVFKKVRLKYDCRLVLCGSMAADDPEGLEIFDEVRDHAGDLVEKGDVILLTVENNILVNVLQRVSKVIIQKSIREGFGLTVTEALWKGTPVVASNKGGIPLQVQHEKTGFSLDPEDDDSFADKVLEILKNPELGASFGAAGREHVRENFLITRLMVNYMDLASELLS